MTPEKYDFVMKVGDTSPAFEFQLKDENADPVDITGFNEVRVLIYDRQDGTLLVDDNTAGNVSVTDGANGIGQYEWQSGDTSAPGKYQAEIEVTYSDGTKETFPRDEEEEKAYKDLKFIEDNDSRSS